MKIFSRGFTLVEMLVVVAVLMIMSAFLVATVNPLAQIQKTNDARRKSDLAQIQRALEAYYQDRNTYPANPGMDQFPYSSSSGCRRSDTDTKIRRFDGTTVEWGQDFRPYMNVVPKDTGTRSYVYIVTCDGQAYYLYASLERGGKDPQACKGNNNQCSGVPSDVHCGGSNICNYGVSSPNVSP